MTLPVRCPEPQYCEVRWHWSEKSQEACQRRTERAIAHAQRIAANPYVYGTFDFDRYERELSKRESAVEAHRAQQPSRPVDFTVTLNGERQLLALSPSDLKILGLLMTRDIFQINRLLRSGRSLSGGAGATVDYAGYQSMQGFVDNAVGVFTDLGTALTLSEPITLYRGIGIPIQPDEYDPDIAGIGEHLRTDGPWQSRFLDLGFSFASGSAEIALLYDGSASGQHPRTMSVLVELSVHRGLCLPKLEYRSQTLFDHLFSTSYLDATNGQVVFPPGTRWDVLSVDTTSEHGVPLVRMKQVALPERLR
jgi:hypothetical protein